MQKIKAVFFDFDWTLFDHKTRSFIPSAIAAINKAHASGVKTFIDSARSYYALRELGTFEKISFDGFVVNNGGAAFTRDNVLYAKYFPEETIKEIVRLAREHGLSYLLVTLKEAYIYHQEGDSNVNHFYSVAIRTSTTSIASSTSPAPGRWKNIRASRSWPRKSS